MAIQIECDECRGAMDGTEEVFCESCFREAEKRADVRAERISDLEDTIKYLKGKLMEYGENVDE